MMTKEEVDFLKCLYFDKISEIVLTDRELKNMLGYNPETTNRALMPELVALKCGSFEESTYQVIIKMIEHIKKVDVL